jgi:hypothetical protein
MPQESQQVPPWAGPLVSRLGAAGEAGVEQLADAVMGIWREIEQALTPVIGARGVAALFNRSLKLASLAHPWLAAARGGALDAVDAAELRAALLRQPANAAAAGGVALFQSFHDLLASLIGAPLTQRLLHAVWAPSTSTPRAQDPLP